MMTAEVNSQRPGWAEPVGFPRPHFRLRRVIGALGVLAVTSVALPWSPSPSLASTASTPVAAPLIPLDAFPVEPKCAFWDTFGAPRPPNRVHEGIDIGAAEGQPVYAVRAGVISKLWVDSPTNRGGNSFRLTSSDGTYFFYGHLSAFADGLTAGARVEAGQVLGYIGHTGNAGTVNHLHFEIHPNGGAAVNPFASLRAVDRCRKPAVVTTSNTLPATTVAAATTAAPTSAAPASAAPATAAPATAAPATAAPTTPAPAPATGATAATRLAIAAPSRVVNSAAGVGNRARSGTRTAYTVTGVGSVPAAATLVLVNVTAVSPGSDGHLTVLPCSAGSVSASTLNFRAGFLDATSALVAPVNGQICVETSASTHVTIDVVGYDGDWSAGVTSIRPTRLLERTTLVAGTPLVVKASGVGGVPPANGVSVTVSVENAAGAGSVALYACDKKQPKLGQVVVGGGPASTGVNTRLAADGTLCLLSSVGVDVTVDATAAWALGGSGKLRAVPAVRAYDSRGSGAVAAGQVVQVTLANDELPWAAKVASVVITGLGASSTGTIAAWPCGQNDPGTAAVTVAAGRTASATTFVGLGGGKLCVSPSTAMHILVDVTGGA